MIKKKWLMLLLLLFLIVCACPARVKASNVTPTPRPTSTPTPTPRPTSTPTPRPTATPIPTPTPVPVTLMGISATYTGNSVKVGDKISKEDIAVVGWYTDGSIEEMADFVLTSDRVLVDGDNNFIVFCSGKTTTVTVRGKKITRIDAQYDYSADPVSIGNRVGRENVTVTATFSDYTFEEVEDYVLGNAVINTVGTQRVMVSYNGMTAELYVPTVAAKNIIGLYVSYLGSGEVMEGSSVPESDIAATAIYSDGTAEKIYNYVMSPATVTERGANTISVYFRGQRATFTIDCVAKKLDKIEAVYNGGSVEVGDYVNPDEIVVTAVYVDGSKEELKEFDLLGARIQVIGRNYVTVSYEEKRVDIEVQGIAKTSLNYNHAASFYVKNEAKEQARIQIPLPRKLGTGAVTGRSLKATSVARVMRMVRAQDAKYIAFEVKPEDEVMDDIFPLLMKVTLPSAYDIEYTSVYFTINRKSIIGRLNVEILGKKELELAIYQPGTYIICYQKPEADDLEDDLEDDYLD